MHRTLVPRVFRSPTKLDFHDFRKTKTLVTVSLSCSFGCFILFSLFDLYDAYVPGFSWVGAEWCWRYLCHTDAKAKGVPMIWRNDTGTCSYSQWCHMETVTVLLATVLHQSERRTSGLQILLTTTDWLLTFTKGLLPDSKQDNIIQHKILSCQETPRATLIKHPEAIPRAQLRWTYFSQYCHNNNIMRTCCMPYEVDNCVS